MAQTANSSEKLETAIEKAVEQIGKQDFSHVDTSTPQAAVASEEPEETKLEVVEPEVDEDAIQGKTLIQALRDPEQALGVIDFLATRAGYTRAELKKPETAASATSDILKIFEDELGDEFKFLAPKIAKGVEKALAGLKTEEPDAAADLRERLDRQELRDINKEIAETHVSLAQSFFGSNDMPTNVITAMSKAMDEFQPAPEMSPDTYYRKIFYQVAGELGLQKRSTRGGAENAQRPREPQLNSRGVTPSFSGNSKKMSIDAAVRLALDQVERGMKTG